MHKKRIKLHARKCTQRHTRRKRKKIVQWQKNEKICSECNDGEKKDVGKSVHCVENSTASASNKMLIYIDYMDIALKSTQ